MSDFFRTLGPNTAMVLVVIAMAFVAAAVHVGLCGWHRAPVQRVTLQPRQRLWVAIVLVLPVRG